MQEKILKEKVQKLHLHYNIKVQILHYMLDNEVQI